MNNVLSYNDLLESETLDFHKLVDMASNMNDELNSVYEKFKNSSSVGESIDLHFELWRIYKKILYIESIVGKSKSINIKGYTDDNLFKSIIKKMQNNSKLSPNYTKYLLYILRYKLAVLFRNKKELLNISPKQYLEINSACNYIYNLIMSMEYISNNKKYGYNVSTYNTLKSKNFTNERNLES